MLQRVSSGDRASTALSLPNASPGGIVMPQLEQSFLDRVMALSTAKDDQTYRQDLTNRIIAESERVAAIQREAAFYEDLLNNLRTGAGRSEDPEAASAIKKRATEAFQDVATAVDQTEEFYREISARNLNPSGVLYTTTRPFQVQVERSLTVQTLAAYFVLVMAITLIVVPTACMVDYVHRTKQSLSVLLHPSRIDHRPTAV
jgi:hypothetical protein